MLIRGYRPRSEGGRFDCRLPTPVFVVGLAALIVARIIITLHPAGVIDVGTASALGAYKLLHGQSLYYFSLGHGDTYGPIAYLAYAPFELLFPGNWGYLPAARAAAITFDLLTIAGLIVLGWRLRSGRDGWRLGLLLAWLWAACPCSLLGMEKSTNDGLVALIVVLVMLALESPIKRGVLVGLGAASKFFPAILLPLVAVGRGDADEQHDSQGARRIRDRGRRVDRAVPAAGRPEGVLEPHDRLPAHSLRHLLDLGTAPSARADQGRGRGRRGDPRGRGRFPSARRAHARHRWPRSPPR